MNKKTFLLLSYSIFLIIPFNSFGQAINKEELSVNNNVEHKSVFNRLNCDCNNPNCVQFKLSSVGKRKAILPSMNQRGGGRGVPIPFPGRASGGGLLQAFLGSILGQ